MPQTSTALLWPVGVPFDARVFRFVVRRTAWPSRVGRVVTRWRSGLVLCDYDSPTAPNVERIFALCRELGLHPQWTEYRRTARGWHLTMQVRERLTLLETVGVQSILGSDPFREAMNWARARTNPGPFWAARANLLFAEKVEVSHGEARTETGARRVP